MRIHDSGIHHNTDNTDTPCTPSAPAILAPTATPTTMDNIPPASPDISCPHCTHNFNSRIGLVGHLRIHRTEAPIYKTVAWRAANLTLTPNHALGPVRDKQDVLVTKAIPDANGWKDHRLVISKMRLRLQPLRRPQGKRSQGKLNNVLLNVPAHHLHFSNELANRLANLPVADADNSVENRWCQLGDIIQSTALDVLGRARRQHQDWFNDNDAAINALLVQKNQLHKAYIDRLTAANKTTFYRMTNGVKQGCILAPTLFSLMFSAMLMDAYCDERPRIRIAYRMDGSHLNQ
ncbi:unnamed protein product [Schistocephalus solidus]|uniref:C2H2-type domain-containing protein n=1 Tax=Schistocephalus solidus TaxID=70667 RepID=A0A183SR98_SCHSO|nr:unnamed protein product [Schistocephalus solidus]